MLPPALPLALLGEDGLDAGGEAPAGAGRNPQPSAREAGRDIARTQPLAVDRLLGRIADRSLQALARAHRAIAGGSVGHRAEALHPKAAVERLLGGVERGLEVSAREEAELVRARDRRELRQGARG